MSALSKLKDARKKLRAIPLKKTGKNEYAGYGYYELGDFLPTTLDVFDELNLIGVVSFTAELATLTITDLDDNSTVVITSPMGSANLKGCHEVQNIGAVETYQRRYLWVTGTELVEHDALDATTGKDRTETKPASKSAQTGDIDKMLKEADSTAALSAVMNGLTVEQRKPHMALFNQRMTELKKAS